MVGGGLIALFTFTILTAIAFGTRAGLIACVISLGILVVTGAAVYTGAITFSFDINKYATSLSSWSVNAVGFLLYAPVAVIALGVVHEHLAASSLQDLRESHVKHERLVDNLVDTFLYRYDTEGVLSYVSSSVTKVLGYSTGEFLTHFTEYLTDHPVNQEVVKHTEQSVNGLQQPPYEMEIYHKNGSVRWLEVSETPVRDRDGEVVAVEGVAHDIIDRKRTEAALRSEKAFTETALNSQQDAFGRSQAVPAHQ